MSLDEFTPDIESSEGSSNSAEATKEVSEKFKEAVKKAGAKVGKTQKDEKKAKKYDFLLANFLVKIIVDKKYDQILEVLFKTMDYGYSSNFILGILSLINIEISNKIREISLKEKIKFEFNSKNTLVFNDSNLPKEIKERINYWIEDIIDSVIIEYSHIKTSKLIELLKNDDNIIQEYCASVFIFFLKDINTTITNSKALNISDFIIGEVKNNLKRLNIKDI